MNLDWPAAAWLRGPELCITDVRHRMLPAPTVMCIVLQVKLAALPWHTGKHRFAGRFEARVVVTGDVLDPTQAAFNQVVQKGAPVHLGF